MRSAISVLSTLLLFGAFLNTASAQTQDTVGTYCNVFYINSDAPQILPFDDDCFVVDQYSIKDPRRFRTLGPIDAHLDLFGHYPWAMNFFLPEVREAERLRVVVPSDFLSKGLSMQPGEMFITLSDNRKSTRFDPITDKVDYISVGGSAKVIEFTPSQGGDGSIDEFKLQMDLRFRQVERTESNVELVGNPVRVRMVLVVETLE